MNKYTKFNVNFIKHILISHSDLINIVNFKDRIWKYGKNSQINWIKENLSNNDIHVLLRIDNKIVAYANLFPLNSNSRKKIFGIGNVSVMPTLRKFGIGSNFLNLIQLHLKFNDKDAILFCKKDLINFYSKNGFRIFRPIHFSTEFHMKNDVFLMGNFSPIKKFIIKKSF